MSVADMTENLELLRALKRMGLKPSETQEIIIHIKPHMPVTVYVKRTAAEEVTDLILTIADGDFQVVWDAKGDSVEKTEDVTLDVQNSVIGHS